ncbi:MAG TPA: hypothetical protein VGX03_14190 [Candidatus Binatia bacterium]|jgi:hypothetical protein|nr:hypothetical protein [Candidatus Binatia bacterium]
MDPLKLAWKFVAFYDLNPQTLRRLALQYGLQECGGFPIVTALSSFPRVSDHMITAVVEEQDPRVRRCLTHQALLTQRVLVLRTRGVRARVRGWLIEIEGGKALRSRALSFARPWAGRSHQ